MHENRHFQQTIILAAWSVLACLSTRADVLLTNLNPASAVYDGGRTNLGVAQPNLALGHSFNIEFVPVANDLSGTVLLMEIGGTANGSGLLLYNGEVFYSTKHNSSDPYTPASLNDTALRPDASSRGEAAVKSSFGALTAGAAYSVALSWNQAGDLYLAVQRDGVSNVVDPFSITGFYDNWSGDESFSVGQNPRAGAGGPGGSVGGLAGEVDGNNPPAPWNVELDSPAETPVLQSFAGTIARALYWNDSTIITPPLASSPRTLIVDLDAAQALYDGGGVDDGGTAGSASGVAAPTTAKGFTFNITFIPSPQDTNGTVLLMEIGGTSNGSGLYLVNGVPTLIGKMASADGNLPSGLNDLQLGGSTAEWAVQSSYGKVLPGLEYIIAVSWNHVSTLRFGVHDGTSLTSDSFATTGTPLSNWYGNNTLSAGIQSNDGSTGGLSGNSGTAYGPPFDVKLVDGVQLPGNISRAVYWNDFASIVPPPAEFSRVLADKLAVTGTNTVTLSWESNEIPVAGSVTYSGSLGVAFTNATGNATNGSVQAVVDGSFGNATFLFDFRDTNGTVVVSRLVCVAGQPSPSQTVRPWIGPEFFSSPLNDWRRTENRMDCIKIGPDRRVDFLTHQLQTNSTLDMSVDVARLDSTFSGRVGFRFAAHGAIKFDYRHNIIQSFGFGAGLDTAGMLFLDDASTPVAWPFGTWRNLRLTLTPSGTNHLALLELRDESSNLITSVQKFIPSGQIYGNLVLLSDANALGGGWGSPVTTFRDWVVGGTNLAGDTSQDWGPILWTQYTLSRGTLKLSAQFPPLGDNDHRTARLEINTGAGWTEVDTASIEDDTYIALFRVDGWDDTADVPFRVVYYFKDQAADVAYEGTIRKDPVEQEVVSIAAMTCMRDLDFPNAEVAYGLSQLDPDVLFFSGDQYYQDDYFYDGAVRTPMDRALLDMLRKWLMFGWSFRDAMRDRPTICLLDDHDNWMANLWGSGGQALSGALENGGYLMPPEFVNASQRVQTAALPDPYDPTPADQGIEVYYTDMLYGRVSMAILEDRKFKHGPNEVSDGGGPVPLASADLLGSRQEAFLADWIQDWNGTDMKVALVETVFDQCHTHAGAGAEFTPIVADKDANGWPGPARDRAVRILRKAFPLMIGGDNHLPTLTHMGVDSHEDAMVAFSNPATAVGFPRKWDPANDAATAATKVAGYPAYAASNFLANPTFNGFPYLGRYTSDFGHPQTLIAVGNPIQWGGNVFGDVAQLYRKSSGFGMTRFNKRSREITIQAYRIDADFSQPQPEQYADWPVTLRQTDNYGRAPLGFLPVVEDACYTNAVLEVADEATGELVYALRFEGRRFRPHVFSNSTYSVRYGYPETTNWVVRTNQVIQPATGLDLRDFGAETRWLVSGQSTRLLWDAPGATNLNISGVGDVTLKTFNGVGRVGVAPTIDTVYTLNVAGSGSADMASFTLRVYETLLQWKARNFSPAQLLDPLVSGDDADPEGDGIWNIYEYYLQTDPWEDSTADGPRLTLVTNAMGTPTGDIEMLARGLLPVGGAHYQLQYSDNLADWFGLPDCVFVEKDGVVQTGGAHETDTVSYITARAVPMDNLVSRFFRVVLAAD